MELATFKAVAESVGSEANHSVSLCFSFQLIQLWMIMSKSPGLVYSGPQRTTTQVVKTRDAFSYSLGE